MSGVLGRTSGELRRAGREAHAAWSSRSAIAVGLLVAAAIVPPATGVLGPLDELAGGLYLALAAVGLGFAVGIGGLPSLAQGAFVGVGAFACALVRSRLGWPFAPAVVLGALAAGAAGLAVGFAAVRLRPAAVAVATFLLSWLALFVLEAFPSAFGGAEGLALAPALSARAHYELALALLAVGVLAFAVLNRSPVGLRLAAVRDHPGAASVAGVPASRLQAQAFAFAAVLAGFAGGLGVDLAGVADPSAYGPSLSFKLFVAVLIGGAVTALGGPAGIALLGLVALVARTAAGSSDQLAARFQTMTSAVLVVLILSAELDGIVPAALRRLRARRLPSHAPVAALAARPGATALRATALTKRYGSVTALAGIDLAVEPGMVAALIGPNGSGKTTALRALAGAIPVDGGRIAVGAVDVTTEPVASRVRLGIVRTLQSAAVFPELTALENVLVAVAGRRRHGGFGRALAATPLYRRETLAARASAVEALDALGLRERADTRADELSTTERRLLAIAIALGADPQILLLDEPSAAVGLSELPRLAAAILGLRARGVGLLVVEHNLRLVRAIADRVMVLDGGRVISAGTPDEVGRDPVVQAAYLGRTVI
jgi:branched-chain amino acid transport system permease protein